VGQSFSMNLTLAVWTKVDEGKEVRHENFKGVDGGHLLCGAFSWGCFVLELDRPKQRLLGTLRDSQHPILSIPNCAIPNCVALSCYCRCTQVEGVRKFAWSLGAKNQTECILYTK